MMVKLPSGKEVEVINIMADGSICDDLSTYLNDHELPEVAKRLIYKFIMAGQALMEANGGQLPTSDKP